MVIVKIDLKNLRNEEHYQFHTDFKKLTEESNPATLGVTEKFSAYLPANANEGVGLDVIRKSEATDDIADADAMRDGTFRGMTHFVKSAANHFNSEKREAAARIQLIFDYHGNLTVKPYDEETAAISNLTEELEKHTADITLLGLPEWITELKANNKSFADLKKLRYTETSSKTQLRMKEVRVLVDAAYAKVTEHINALIVINGEAAYDRYVNELNQRIDSYSKLLAQRKGRNAKASANGEQPVA